MIGLDQGGRSRPVLETRTPTGGGVGLADQLWAETEDRQFANRPWRVVPDASPQIIALRRTTGLMECWVVGARSTHVDVDRTGRELTCGIQLRPGSLGPLFSIGGDELTDRAVPLEHIAGRAGRALLERLHAETGAAGILRQLDAFVRALGASARAIDRRVRAFSEIAEQRPDASVAAIAGQLSVSTRTLSGRIKREVGLTPKRLLRIVRAHRVADAAVTNTESGTALAHRLGFHDQAHMLHDFTCLMGETPRRFAARAID